MNKETVEYKKMIFYSAHDSNIHAILEAFDLSNPDCIKNKQQENCVKEVPFAS